MGNKLVGKGAGGGGARESITSSEDEGVLQESGGWSGKISEVVGGAYLCELQGLVRGFVQETPQQQGKVG